MIQIAHYYFKNARLKKYRLILSEENRLRIGWQKRDIKILKISISHKSNTTFMTHDSRDAKSGIRAFNTLCCSQTKASLKNNYKV